MLQPQLPPSALHIHMDGQQVLHMPNKIEIRSSVLKCFVQNWFSKESEEMSQTVTLMSVTFSLVH